ncbi:MAG TPA: T9SS type A sorting domain-containing protein [Chitinophagaceae bacterium]|nr:T9SS type A sorting domain-containing protein [Chitinophagaceae bacterium]
MKSNPSVMYIKHRSIKINILLLLLIGLFSELKAQEAIPISGGNASGSGGSSSYSVGQIVYTTNEGSSGSIAQGVQQPYEITIITAVDEANDINLTILTYPNPTTDFLRLQIDETNTLNVRALRYQLFNLNGKLLQDGKVAGRNTNIRMSNLVSATYFLKIIYNNKNIKTFKIIKN